MPAAELSTSLGVIVVAAPAMLVAALGASSLVGRPLSERMTNRLTPLAILAALLAATGMLGLMLAQGTREVPVELGDWVKIPHYHFSIKLVFDRLSVPFVILSLALCGTISAFASRYMHREGGYNRFFALFSLFVLGMVVAALAGTIETLFAGWELVGISSALLVAFFQERTAPVRNGLRIWSVYRVSDAALLVAAVMLHHLTGGGDFAELMGRGPPWPYGEAAVTPNQAFIVGLLLLVAAAGKSALVPFSGWLPRAMEGPTPSSAVFYGALSVHLGAYLLLRISPLLEASPLLSAIVVGLGLVTALTAWVAGRAQTDIKSALSYASLTQVGIIVAEIGLGLRYIALAHLIGHASLRTLQFLRAPSLLHDYRTVENAIGGRLPRASGGRAWLPPRVSAWLYRLALDRFYFDAWLNEYVAAPVLKLFRWCDALERRWTDWLTGGASRESDALDPAAGSLEEVS